jgi:hypothetical protein
MSNEEYSPKFQEPIKRSAKWTVDGYKKVSCFIKVIGNLNDSASAMERNILIQFPKAEYVAIVTSYFWCISFDTEKSAIDAATSGTTKIGSSCVNVQYAARPFIYRTNALPVFYDSEEVMKEIKKVNPEATILKIAAECWPGGKILNGKFLVMMDKELSKQAWKTEKGFALNAQPINRTYAKKTNPETHIAGKKKTEAPKNFTTVGNGSRNSNTQNWRQKNCSSTPQNTKPLESNKNNSKGVNNNLKSASSSPGMSYTTSTISSENQNQKPANVEEHEKFSVNNSKEDVNNINSKNGNRNNSKNTKCSSKENDKNKKNSHELKSDNKNEHSVSTKKMDTSLEDVCRQTVLNAKSQDDVNKAVYQLAVNRALARADNLMSTVRNEGKKKRECFSTPSSPCSKRVKDSSSAVVCYTSNSSQNKGEKGHIDSGVSGVPQC